MIKVLNFIGDRKYIEWLIPVFDTTDMLCSHEYIFVGKSDYNFNSIRSLDRIKIFNAYSALQYINIQKPNAIILHGLGGFPTELIPSIEKSIKIIWFAWGYDLYNPIMHKPFINISLYGPLTKKAKYEGLIHRLRELHGYLHLLKKSNEIKRGISRIDYFSGVFPVEGKLMQQQPFFKAKIIDFNYFTLGGEIKVENMSKSSTTGRNILVGNSGDPTNNHIDAYKKIKVLNIQEVDIYSFLSYGGTKEYIRKVVEYGYLFFGDRYHPITDFLAFDEYKKIILKCGNVIMYHERQQAVGNLYSTLWSGCKLFLSDTSISYNYLKSLGYNLFSFQKDFSIEEVKKPLSEDIVMENRKILLNNCSLEKSYSKLYNIYKIIEESTNEN